MGQFASIFYWTTELPDFAFSPKRNPQLARTRFRKMPHRNAAPCEHRLESTSDPETTTGSSSDSGGCCGGCCSAGFHRLVQDCRIGLRSLWGVFNSHRCDALLGFQTAEVTGQGETIETFRDRFTRPRQSSPRSPWSRLSRYRDNRPTTASCACAPADTPPGCRRRVPRCARSGQADVR